MQADNASSSIGFFSFVKMRDRFARIMNVGDTPHRIALTFSVGLFLGVSPLIGVHTVLALLVAWAFGLNRFVILSGVFVTNPWSMVPIYTFCTWIGTVLLRVEGITEVLSFDSLSLKTLSADLGLLLMPFIVGTLVVGSAGAVSSYLIVRLVIRRARLASGSLDEAALGAGGGRKEG